MASDTVVLVLHAWGYMIVKGGEGLVYVANPAGTPDALAGGVDDVDKVAGGGLESVPPHEAAAATMTIAQARISFVRTKRALPPRRLRTLP